MFIISVSLFLISIISLNLVISAPISNPHLHDHQIHNIVPKYFDSKKSRNFHNATPIILEHVPVVRLQHNDPTCAVDFKIRWSTSVASSVFSTPVIFPAGPEGRKWIFLNTFYQSMEVIGSDGYKPWGWPLSFEGSSFQGSPMLFDIDGDGANDIGAVDKNGNMFWVRMGAFGQYLEDYHVQIPKLKVQKDW